MTESSTTLISVDRVKTLLQCYGADPQTWPQRERAAALALIYQSAELMQLLNEAQQLDALLQTQLNDTPANANDAFVARVMNSLPAQDSAPAASRHISSRTRGLAGLAAGVLVVVSVIFFGPQSNVTQDGPLMSENHLAEFEQWAIAEMAKGSARNSANELDTEVALLLELDDAALEY